MTATGTTTAPVLEHRFASALPELAVPWRAATVERPELIRLNEPLARELGLDAAWLRSEAGRRLLAGNELPEGAQPVAQAYAGHQFGAYSPLLGDGRALLLGELVAPDGTPRDVHLKGSGPTPFARGGDGYAAVGPMLREYVLGEAMHALGIPTTRALAVVATGAVVRREEPLPGAVLVRVAASHLRVGTFQYARSTGDLDLLRRLTEHAIARHAPAAARAPIPALGLFDAVVAAQARLVAQWMLVGFVHGVMNTDNTAISGETIDYGPCAFLDGFDAGAVFSSIDHQGRYQFCNQPAIAQWNLGRLADALLPLIDDDQERAVELATASLRAFMPRHVESWTAGMRAKLGLAPASGPAADADPRPAPAPAPDADAAPTPDADAELIEAALTLLQSEHVDHTSFFRRLGAGGGDDLASVRDLFVDRDAVDAWLERWLARSPDRAAMDRVNPAYIPRNHLVEEARAAASDDADLEPLDRLLDAVTRPFDERPGLERYAEPAPDDHGRYITFCGT